MLSAEVAAFIVVLFSSANQQTAGTGTYKATTEPVADSQPNPDPNAKAATSKRDRTYSPVIERFIPLDLGHLGAIDFESGKVLEWPQAWLNTSRTGVIKEESQWMRSNSIDASGSGWHLIGHGTVGKVSQIRFEDIAPHMVVETVSDPSLPNDMRPEMHDKPPRYPITYLFRTREGSMGVLEIIGFSNKPKGHRIRYKLVEEAGHHAFILPIRLASTKRQARHWRYTWRIMNSQAVHLMHGWYSLVDGQIREHVGGGTNHQGTPTPFNLTLEAKVNQGQLVLAMKRDWRSDDGSQAVAVTSRTEVPADATCRIRVLEYGTFLRADRYQLLWRAEWLRGDQRIKTISYAARVAGPVPGGASFPGFMTQQDPVRAVEPLPTAGESVDITK